MKKHFSLISLTALAIIASYLSANAQYSTLPIPGDNSIGWNGLTSDVVAQSGFVDIIPSGYPLQPPPPPGPTNPPVYEVIVPLEIPFGIFLGSQFPPKFNIGISTSGYISFNGSYTTDHDGFPYNLLPLTSNPNQAYQNRLVMAFWGDFVPVQGSQGRIWYKIDGVGPTSEHVDLRSLTIEWNVQDRLTGTPVGKFQAKFFAYSYDIELHYGPSDFLFARPTVGDADHYGAVVGLKNLGQNTTEAIGRLDTSSGNDFPGREVMIILHPDRQLGPLFAPPISPNPTFLTRLGYFNNLQPFPPLPAPNPGMPVPEWYANYYPFLPTPNPYKPELISPFHFGFPKIASSPVSYRIRPINSDPTPSTWPDAAGMKSVPEDPLKSRIWLPAPVRSVDICQGP